MEIYKFLQAYMDENNMKIAEIARICDLPDSTVRGIITRKQKSVALEVAFKLSDGLNVSLEKLNGSPERQVISNIPLSSIENNIIKKYRTLDGYGKDAVQAILDLEYNRCADAALVDETPKVISLRLSEQSAAAGTGTYLGPEQFRTIYVKESDIARRAAYCIPVSGDSMEPVYRDGDILLVSSEQAKIGDIGIFTLSGKGYVKKRGNDVLLSLNGKYVPIPMDESIVCNGKVIGVLDKSEIVSNG